ncbi:MAG: hypothetical protein K6F94_06375 [Bacteroidaceae bacterium]|nr:hypothetical protein [Bacteroidaceae bacterium]
MEKKVYILPAMEVTSMSEADNILLSISNNTKADSSIDVQSKEQNDWNIWDEE